MRDLTGSLEIISTTRSNGSRGFSVEEFKRRRFVEVVLGAICDRGSYPMQKRRDEWNREDDAAVHILKEVSMGPNYNNNPAGPNRAPTWRIDLLKLLRIFGEHFKLRKHPHDN
jgi:hypothetical protein